jgi:hypothetical protein
VRVRLLASISGSRNGVDWPPPGVIIDLPDAEGADYCASGLASPVASTGKVEKAVAAKADVETRAEAAAEPEKPVEPVPAKAAPLTRSRAGGGV